MDSILIQTQFPHRVSLSQAAEISGYHQDYLGQLCRLGKIRASKIGRNWYTTQTELKVLLSGDHSEPEEQEEQEEQISVTSMDAVQPIAVQVPVQTYREVARPTPVIADNYVISEVEGIPIELRTQSPARAEHTVQTLITRMKLDTLKNEVLAIAQSVDTISEQLARHEQILEQLQSQAYQRVDLRESFAPGLTAAPRQAVRPESLITIIDEEEQVQEPVQQWAWVVPAIAVMMVVIPVSLLAFLPTAQSPAVEQTVYYQTESVQLAPQVAGESEVAQ